MALVSGAVRQGEHLVLEMPTGSGKTVVLLAGVVSAARALEKRILYVTRTNSQQEQTVRELRAIQPLHPALRAFALQGRSRLCLKLEDESDPEWAEATPEELGHYCSAAKAASDDAPRSSRACTYFARLKTMDEARLQEMVGSAPQTAEWLRREGRARGFCPYEATKRLIAGSDVVVAPYVFALDAGLRRRLLQWWGCTEQDVVLIVDEAHNLPEYLRALGSPRLTRDRLRRALGEAKDLGNPEILRGVGVHEFLESLAVLLDRVVLEYCKEEDGFVPPFELEAHLMESYTTTSRTLVEAAHVIQRLGEIVKDRRRAVGKIPRSHLGQVGSFLERWFESDEGGYVKIAGREAQPYLEAFLVDTARLGELFRGFHATVHASGTLDPLEEYRDSLGLPDSTRLERFPSPFPQERLAVRAVAGVTTRFETLRDNPDAVSRLQDTLHDILRRVRLRSEDVV